MTLTGYRASPTAVTLTAPSGPGWRHRRRDRPERRACAALRDTRAAPGPAARRAGDPVRRSARGERSTPEGGRNTVRARECVTTQGSEVEDRADAPTELAARFSAATRTQPHEPSRSAGAIRSHSSADVSAQVSCYLRCPSYVGASSKCSRAGPEAACCLAIRRRQADVRFISYISAEEPADTLIAR